MIFGQVANPGEVDFTLPADSPDTKRVLSATKSKRRIISNSFQN